MERLEVEAGKTVILHGPASVVLIDGKASIFDYMIPLKRRIVVKSWRSRPIYIEKDSILEYTYGEGGGVEVVDNDTVPEEWRDVASELGEKRRSIAVYGGPDSGKTSLSTLMANNLIKLFGSAAYVDLDLGQSNICPPTTIGYVNLVKMVPDISLHRMDYGEVVGYTSPTPMISRHVEASRRLLQNLRERLGEAPMVSDLDGWVSDRGAISHKIALLKVLRPDLLLSIGGLPEEVRDASSELGIALRELPPPKLVRRRELSARKKLRAMAYSRFLRNSAVRKIPISWVKLEDLRGCNDVREISSRIVNLLSRYVERLDLMVEGGGIDMLEELSKKGLGVLSYIYDLSNRFSGIGILLSLNQEKNYLRIYTPFREQINRIIVGSILLSLEGDEVYAIPPTLP